MSLGRTNYRGNLFFQLNNMLFQTGWIVSSFIQGKTETIYVALVLRSPGKPIGRPAIPGITFPGSAT